LTVSTSECTASLSMAAEPVSTAATNFAAATSKLPASAAQTAFRVPLFAMLDSSLKNRLSAPTED
jgi:hypothetical protein